MCEARTLPISRDPAIRQRAAEMVAAGYSRSRIGRELNVQHATVRALLRPLGEGPPRVLCRNCELRQACRPRGLCWRCFYTPAVREQFPSTSKYARRGTGNVTGRRPTPASATAAGPGSEEKIAVLTQRAAAGACLWHPADVRHRHHRANDPRRPFRTHIPEPACG